MTNVHPLPEAAPSFEDFWLLYPRRVAKKDAWKAWGKLTPDQHLQAVVACASWRRIWAGMELNFIPHPATWLNGWRFEDELPTAVTVSAAAHQPAVLPKDDAPRGAMPDNVRAMIARMKGK